MFDAGCEIFDVTAPFSPLMPSDLVGLPLRLAIGDGEPARVLLGRRS